MSNVISAAAIGLPFPASEIDFELGQRVSVIGTEISGYVSARTKYLTGADKLEVCIIDTDNRERKYWYSCRNLVRV